VYFWEKYQNKIRFHDLWDLWVKLTASCLWVNDPDFIGVLVLPVPFLVLFVKKDTSEKVFSAERTQTVGNAGNGDIRF